ncbi:MAG: monovalent cation/H(+) antiporter subunit G [Bauldia sp.]
MTLDLVREWLGGGLVAAGAAFMLIGAIGLLRMPDVFTRMHATSVSDTLGAGLILLGLVVLAGASLAAVKLLLLALFFGLMSPVSTHAVARAALHAGVKPVLADGVEVETSSREGQSSTR